MEVRAVPAREAIVDGLGELRERVGSGRSKDPSRARPQVLAMSLDEFDTDRQP